MRSISASATSPLARGARCASGTPARSSRAGSATHSRGRNSRKATGAGTSSRARVRDTRVWQLAFLPSAPAYWCATPTEAEPFFGSAVSSTTSTASGPPSIASAFAASAASSGAPSQAGLATTLCSWSCAGSPRRADIGCTLLRSPGSSRPRR
jgi:hypothetical protein